tara:strand:- start:56 stop:262 length:207 start_codon:yes stop_codon:yes gene_type:complete
MKIKQYSTDLIEDLDKVFPRRHPSLEDTDREIWYKAGQRSVVDLLQSSVEHGEEDNELPTLLNTNKED